MKRAPKNDEVFELVERLIRAEEVSRGFLILKKAERLDLTAERMVCDEKKPYHHLAPAYVVQIAKAWLTDHGHTACTAKPPTVVVAGEPVAPTPAVTLAPGHFIRCTDHVVADGTLSLALI